MQLAVAGWAAQTRTADVIFTNAHVWTVDQAQPTAGAVAIVGEKIVEVGTTEKIEKWRGPTTRVIDAHAHTVMPGFNDAHVHLLEAGLRLGDIALKDAKTPAEFARRIAERAKGTRKGEWILGGQWDDQLWDPPALPTAALIDAQTPTTPVFVKRYDGHMGLANSLAMRLASITAQTPNPPGGAIVRDAAGNPTGIFKDAAMALVERVIPELTAAQRRGAIQRALAYMSSFGVTSAQDMLAEADTIRTYAELARRGALTVRIYAVPPETDSLRWKAAGALPNENSAYLHTDGVKALADGSLGSTTAYFFEPYSDAPQMRGMLSDEMQPPSAMLERLTKLDAAGKQLIVHAIGDQAISLVLDMFETITRTSPLRDRRLRIEHAQHMAPKDFDRFARLSVIASVQPYHAIDDGRWAERRIGPERVKTSYAYRTFLDHGVRLALGTDWYHAALDPMWTLYAAVTRATLDGKNPGGWVPQQKITLQEAVEAYTLGSAYAEFREKEKGSLTPGRFADIVLLSGDLFATPPAQIPNLKVDLTMVGGKVVYERRAAPLQ